MKHTHSFRPSRALAALCLCAGLASQTVPAMAAQYQGFVFEDTIRLGDTDLRLNGLGMRAVLFIKGYAAGLYLSQKADTPEAVYKAPGAKRVQLRMMRDAKAADFHRSLVSGMRKNATPDELARLQDRLVQLEEAIDAVGAVKQGDTINLDFVPARGLTLSVNGQVRGKPVAGADFFNTLLEIFVGERPVDANLKRGLLGQPVTPSS